MPQLNKKERDKHLDDELAVAKKIEDMMEDWPYARRVGLLQWLLSRTETDPPPPPTYPDGSPAGPDDPQPAPAQE